MALLRTGPTRTQLMDALEKARRRPTTPVTGGLGEAMARMATQWVDAFSDRDTANRQVSEREAKNNAISRILQQAMMAGAGPVGRVTDATQVQAMPEYAGQSLANAMSSPQAQQTNQINFDGGQPINTDFGSPLAVGPTRRQILASNPATAELAFQMQMQQEQMGIQRQQALDDAKLKNANEWVDFQRKEQFKQNLKDGFENFANINISGRNVRSAMKDGVLYIVGKTGKLQPAADILPADDFLNVSNQVNKTQEVNIGKLANLSPGQQDRLVQLETSGNSFIVNSKRARKALAKGGGVGSAVGDISVFVDNTARNLGNLTRSLAGTVLKDGSVLTSDAIKQDISKAMSLFGDLPKEQARFVATAINLTYAKALMLNGTRPTNEDFTNSYSAIIGGSNNPETIIENILFEENLLLDGIEGQWNRLAPEEKFKFDRGGASGDSLPNVSTQEQFNDLPSGALYMEYGVRMRKP
tara:strand:+ start:390 stop:1802 length:1413 start_codon:yes stop_codon:yes gene_type:complete